MFTKKNCDIVLFFVIVLCLLSLSFSLTKLFMVSKPDTENNSDIEFTLCDKKISILGDSISTFDGYSNDILSNSTIGNNLARYPQSNLTTDVNDTWWKKVIDYFNADLLVNNSWRGTQVLGTDDSCGYKNRCQQLHNDNTNVIPDIIFVYMGINDIALSARNCGNFNSLFEIYNPQSCEYVSPTTFAQAYAIMVHKIITKYGNANVFLFTLPQNSRSVSEASYDNLRCQYNNSIRKIASYFNCGVIDFAYISNWNSSIHTGDGLHPNSIGMEILSSFTIKQLEYYFS